MLLTRYTQVQQRIERYLWCVSSCSQQHRHPLDVEVRTECDSYAQSTGQQDGSSVILRELYKRRKSCVRCEADQCCTKKKGSSIESSICPSHLIIWAQILPVTESEKLQRARLKAKNYIADLKLSSTVSFRIICCPWEGQEQKTPLQVISINKQAIRAGGN